MWQLGYRQLSAESSKDVSQLQAVLDSAPGYYETVQGCKPQPDQAVVELEALPESCSSEQKHFYIIEDQSNPIGCLDILRGYPDDSVAFIGLLLFIQSHQGCGLGPQALDFSEVLARQWGCSVLRLGVIAANHRALSFWTREGFVELYHKHSEEHASEVVVMERKVAAFSHIGRGM